MNKNSSRQLIRLFQQHINDIIKDFSDCSICALCCKDEALTITQGDAFRISKKLGIDKKTFYDQYTHPSPDHPETVMNMPCVFLENNRCTIYDIRPDMCRKYPIFVTDDIVFINEIEGCAKATHFHELFLDYCEKYHPNFYKNIKNPSEDMKGKQTIKNAYYSINIIARFIEWLDSKENEK